ARRHSRPWLSITGSRTLITRWRPVIAAEHLQWGGELFVNNTVLSGQLFHTNMNGCAQHSQ
ncbi:unnamed protein product, partial [Staurois parvus]